MYKLIGQTVSAAVLALLRFFISFGRRKTDAEIRIETLIGQPVSAASLGRDQYNSCRKRKIHDEM